MRAFVTGATGFVGGRLARRLRDRGDEVVALVRSPERAASLQDIGCELVRGDLGDESMGEIADRIAELSGRKPPRFSMPPAMIKASLPLAPMVTRLLRLPPNLPELIRAADGVTYWATDAKARRELGYAPRDLATGLRQTLAAL